LDQRVTQWISAVMVSACSARELLPGPGLLRLAALGDRERPFLQRRVRCGAGRQHREPFGHVLTWRQPTFLSGRGAVQVAEAARDRAHRRSAPLRQRAVVRDTGPSSPRPWKPTSSRVLTALFQPRTGRLRGGIVHHLADQSASGLPRVSARIWSRARASSDPLSVESSSACASSRGRRSTVSSGSPAGSSPRDPHREHHADRVGRQPSRHEPENLRRGPVQPLRVIDQADQRPLFGCL